MEPITIPITDVLDLHTFQPKDVPLLLADYLSACVDAEIFSVRIIHGKGTGALRERVHSILKKNPLVVSFGMAPAAGGGWGATLVELKRGGA
jgi:dsDNA-specific endonuclease/ATPase MutS2